MSFGGLGFEVWGFGGELGYRVVGSCVTVEYGEIRGLGGNDIDTAAIIVIDFDHFLTPRDGKI